MMMMMMVMIASSNVSSVLSSWEGRAVLAKPAPRAAVEYEQHSSAVVQGEQEQFQIISAGSAFPCSIKSVQQQMLPVVGLIGLVREA